MKTFHFHMPSDEIGMCYTHVDHATGKQIMLATDRINEWLDEQLIPFVLTDVDPDFAEHCRARHGVEELRLSDMTLQHLLYPITYADWGDGSCLLIDGNHRYVWAARNGIKLIRARVIRFDDWQHFIVRGVPKLKDPTILHRMYSGRT